VWQGETNIVRRCVPEHEGCPLGRIKQLKTLSPMNARLSIAGKSEQHKRNGGGTSGETPNSSADPVPDVKPGIALFDWVLVASG
jgi:hypothetical protein